MKQKNLFYLLLMIVSALMIAVIFYGNGHDHQAGQPAVVSESSASRLQEAFQHHESGFTIQVTAPVFRILPDDNEGSRHQRLIIRLPSGQTVLISHNIDLAPRVENVNVGDALTVYGQYEWNDRGGVIHWTHRDPRGIHPAGWIEHKGRRYQ